MHGFPPQQDLLPDNFVQSKRYNKYQNDELYATVNDHADNPIICNVKWVVDKHER